MEDHLNLGFQDIVLQVRRVSTIVYLIQFHLFHTISAYYCHWCQCKYGYRTVPGVRWSHLLLIFCLRDSAAISTCSSS